MSDAAGFRALPSVDRLAGAEGASALVARYGRAAVVDAARDAIDAARESLKRGQPAPDADALLNQMAVRLHAQFAPTLRPVINATGVIIHTNLGRAPLSDEAARAVSDIASQYNTLEYNLEAGARGSRLLHADVLLREITGAEAALVVNNNAAALVLLLSALAQGRGVIISRGQLVEIGGGFRVPEVMEQSGAVLIEVGATNRTRPSDFTQAISHPRPYHPPAAMLMRAHASNFKQIGFTEEVSLAEMSAIAHAHGLLCVDDLGSGALLDTAAYGLEHEPTVQESLAAGCDLVAFSADKLLGGPQAGILAGKKAIIDVLKRHPLARAVRADKLCLAGLSATLEHYRRGEAIEKIPVWRMMALSADAIRAQAASWAELLGPGASVVESESTVGGGSLPGATLPTFCLALDGPSPNTLAARLRACDTPIIARVQDDRLLLDPRTVLPGQAEALLAGLRAALSGG
ncbi:MAG: L-seryl-tRNA(Sec) selenium transferase [Pleurocapsa minor GSE-CHR-MK-17-07R]|nr:L-seryl-tRNA(Sec) selenium transferase [Pleurocapsa minor GSE-CHR-MK 17-07R]